MTSLLKLYLEKKGYRPVDIAKLLNVSPSAVSSWITGRAKPRLKIAKRLRRFCDAPITMWGYKEEIEENSLR